MQENNESKYCPICGELIVSFPDLDRGWHACINGHKNYKEDTLSVKPYGFCPICFSPSVSRERRLNGCDTCEKQHTFLSRDALKEVPENKCSSVVDMYKYEWIEKKSRFALNFLFELKHEYELSNFIKEFRKNVLGISIEKMSEMSGVPDYCLKDIEEQALSFDHINKAALNSFFNNVELEDLVMENGIRWSCPCGYMMDKKTQYCVKCGRHFSKGERAF